MSAGIPVQGLRMCASLRRHPYASGTVYYLTTVCIIKSSSTRHHKISMSTNTYIGLRVRICMYMFDVDEFLHPLLLFTLQLLIPVYFTLTLPTDPLYSTGVALTRMG